MAGSYKFGSKKEIVKSITIDPKGIVRLSGNKIDVAKKGDRGLQGIPGKKGDFPRHVWRGTEISIEFPDGTWGPWVNLKGEPGRDGHGRDGIHGSDGGNGVDGKDAVGTPGRNGTDGKDGIGTPGKDGQDGKNGKEGAPGVEPGEMATIRIDLGLMMDSIKRMFERLAQMDERLADVKNGKDGKDGRPGRDGESKQGFPGIQGDKGEPGIPPHDWNLTLNNVAELMQKMESVIMEFRQMGVEI